MSIGYENIFGKERYLRTDPIQHELRLIWLQYEYQTPNDKTKIDNNEAKKRTKIINMLENAIIGIGYYRFSENIDYLINLQGP